MQIHLVETELFINPKTGQNLVPNLKTSNMLILKLIRHRAKIFNSSFLDFYASQLAVLFL